MKDLWERFKRFCNGQDRIERRSRGFELHMELPVIDTERARKQARDELRDEVAPAALIGLLSDEAFAAMSKERAQERQGLDRVKAALIKSRLPLTRIASRRLWWRCIAAVCSYGSYVAWRFSDLLINRGHAMEDRASRIDDQAARFAYRCDYWADVFKELRAND